MSRNRRHLYEYLERAFAGNETIRVSWIGASWSAEHIPADLDVNGAPALYFELVERLPRAGDPKS